MLAKNVFKGQVNFVVRIIIIQDTRHNSLWAMDYQDTIKDVIFSLCHVYTGNLSLIYTSFIQTPLPLKLQGRLCGINQ